MDTSSHTHLELLRYEETQDRECNNQVKNPMHFSDIYFSSNSPQNTLDYASDETSDGESFDAPKICCSCSGFFARIPDLAIFSDAVENQGPA